MTLLNILAIWMAASIIAGLFLGRLIAVSSDYVDRPIDFDAATSHWSCPECEGGPGGVGGADCVCAATDPSEVVQG